MKISRYSKKSRHDLTPMLERSLRLQEVIAFLKANYCSEAVDERCESLGLLCEIGPFANLKRGFFNDSSFRQVFGSPSRSKTPK
jgi:hypothetical protein